MTGELFPVINGSIATVAAAGAAKVKIGDASAVTIQFTRADHDSGSSNFEVEVSNDGTNWVVYNKLITNVTNTNGETLLRAAAPTLSSDTSEVHTISPEDSFQYLRVSYVRTTDGTTDCDVWVQRRQ